MDAIQSVLPFYSVAGFAASANDAMVSLGDGTWGAFVAGLGEGAATFTRMVNLDLPAQRRLRRESGAPQL